MGSGLPAGSSGHAPGTVVGRRYRLDGVIGVGGMGVVHRATDQIMRRTVAVKEVRMPTGSPAANADARERVLREARSAGRIHHPGAVGVLDVIDDGELPWIVMELVEGEPLSARVEREGGLPVEEVAQIGISLAYALDAAHRLGVVHRDVKPSNVLLTQDGQARLTDFGIAVSNGDPRLTRTGEVVGSPAYLAPERAHGEPGGPECDVWGLGATLYAAVEGEPPFGGATPLDILTSVVEGLIRPPRHAGRLGPLLDGMLSQRELDRPTLTSVRTRLRDLAGETPGRPSVAGQTRTTTRPTGPPPRRPATSSPGRAPAAPPSTPGPANPRPATARAATPATPRPAAPSPAAPVTPLPVEPTAAEPVTASAAGAGPAADGTAAASGTALAGPTRVLAEAPVSEGSPDLQPAEVPSAEQEAAPATSGADEARVPTTVIMKDVLADETVTDGRDPRTDEAQPTSTLVGGPSVNQPTPDATEVLQPRGDAGELDDLARYWASGSAWTSSRPAGPPDDGPASEDASGPVEDPPRPPRPKRPGEETPPRSQAERRAVIVLAVLVVVLALALVAVRLSADDGKDNRPASAPAAATSDLGPSAPASAVPDGPLAAATTTVTPPRGWVSYVDAAGWSLAYPSSWKRSAGVGGTGTVDFTNPATGTVLRVGSAGQAPASILRDWLTNFDTASQGGPMGLTDYQRLRLAPVGTGDGSTEADWEYTYSKDGGKVHVLSRGADRGGHGYLLSWQTEDKQWASDQGLRRQLFATFRPAP
ncbi:serine/threonine-protein kinase [Pseudofrankia inefficax]|nr:serine/threonine-protein kinase [Pseudofrankia inefficax]